MKTLWSYVSGLGSEFPNFPVLVFSWCCAYCRFIQPRFSVCHFSSHYGNTWFESKFELTFCLPLPPQPLEDGSLLHPLTYASSAVILIYSYHLNSPLIYIALLYALRSVHQASFVLSVNFAIVRVLKRFVDENQASIFLKRYFCRCVARTWFVSELPI
jgi:hypothetical protein